MTPYLRKILTFVGTLVILPAAPAAVVAWSSQYVPETASTNIDASWYSVLSTSGTLVRAENSGGAALNIDFNLDTVTDIAFAAPTFSLGATHEGFYNGAASNALINTGTWSGAPGTLPLTGLTGGSVYQVQLLFADARAGQNGRAVSVDGAAPQRYAYNGGTWGFRLYTGTFIADGGIQNIALQVFESDGLTSAGSQLNAFQLRLVPEPGMLGLLGLGGIGWAARRRRIS